MGIGANVVAETWVVPAWSERFSVGIEELDNQHKQLLLLCKRTVDSLKTEDGRVILSEARGVLDELVEYIRHHFRTEERLMQERGYPDYVKHREEHALYEMKLETLLQEAEGGLLDMGEFIHYLTGWWSDHILVTDRAYAPYVAAPQQQSAG